VVRYAFLADGSQRTDAFAVPGAAP